MARTRTQPQPSPSAYKLQVPLFPTLPFDLGVETFCWLPVKSLLQLRCVCKSWKYLISDPKFAKKHVRSSPTDFTRHHLILGYNTLPSDTFKFRIKDFPLLSVFNAAMPAPATELGYNRSDNLNSIMVACDDIIIVADCNICILLWNPSTRRFKESPPLGKPPQKEGVVITLGFGYDNLADRYKVVVVYCYETDTRGYIRNKTDAELYKKHVKVNTLGTYLWRKIQEFPSCVPLIGKTGRFVSDTLNWLVTDGSNWFINSLDLGNEIYQKLLPPDDGSEPVNFFGVLKDCLCVLYGDSRVWNVWLIKSLGLNYSVLRQNYYKGLCAIHIYEDDQVLVVQFFSELFLYNSRDDTLKSLQIQTPRPCISMVSGVYVESLISPCFRY